MSSTADGGGVAEMLHALVGYVEDLDISIRWLVIHGDADFFSVCRVHIRQSPPIDPRRAPAPAPAGQPGRHDSVRYRRAPIIMASASGTRAPGIARLVAAYPDTVRDVIHAFSDRGLAMLAWKTSADPAYDVHSSRARRAFLPFSRTIQATSRSALSPSARKRGNPAAGSAATATLQQ